jgi:methionyl-tRNA synthetase
MRCPNHPNIELQWLTEKNWFFRLSAYRDRLLAHFEANPDWVQPEYRKNEMLAFLKGGLEDISISRETFHWGIPFPIAENGETAEREDGSWDPEAGVIYVWFDALINYITGAGFPDDPEGFARWWPADLHVIGKDINRFHTIIWPAMLMSAGIEPPRKVWVHGFLLAAGGDRMSKSRGNMLDPSDVVAAFGPDGARYVALREVPFDKDAEVSWDSFVRRYNADLANDFGNLVNRTVSMAGRYLAGARPTPRGAADAPLAAAWAKARGTYVEKLDGLLLHDALAALWEFVGDANRFVDAEQPWVLAKSATPETPEAAAARDRLSGVLGDLVEAVRLVSLASAPYLPSIAPRALAQLGFEYGYAPDGNGGPPLLAELAWGRHASEPGMLGKPEPLFPRLEVEAVDSPAG